MRISRHHHMAMELCPNSEASPQGIRGITPLQEAPPRGLRGITSWPWGTTTTPRGITSFRWGTTMKLLLRGSMELRPTDEAPPRPLTTRVMELYPTHTLYMFHPPNQEFAHHINIMYNRQVIQLMFFNSYPIKQHTIPFSNSHINHGIILYPPSKACRSDKQVTHGGSFNNCTQNCLQPRSS